MENLQKLVSVKGSYHTAHSMGLLGGMLEMALEEVSDVIPEVIQRAWSPFFQVVHVLKEATARRKEDIAEDPRLTGAEARVRTNFKLVVDTVHNSTLSTVGGKAEAAERVKPMLPENFDMLKTKRHNWMGEVEAIVTALRRSSQTDLETLNLWDEVSQLRVAIRAYQRLFMAIVYEKKIPTDQNLSILLTDCRNQLQWVILILVTYAYQNPDSAPLIERMLQPYFNFLAMSKKKKSATSDSDEGPSNDNGASDEETAETADNDQEESAQADAAEA